MKSTITILLLCAGVLAGCDTYPDISDDNSNRPDPSEASNDTPFGASNINEEQLIIGTLSSDNLVDYHKFNLPRLYSGTVVVTLTGLTTNVDIELLDYNLNLLSWSRESDTSSEQITLWHDASFNSESYDTGLYFVRVYTNSNNLPSPYTLEYNFDTGNAE